MTRVLTVGETMALLTAGSVAPISQATTFTLAAAGCESNVAVGLQRLGVPAAWIGRVGDDEFGRLVLRLLRGEGIDVSRAIVDPETYTSLMVKGRRTGSTTTVSYYRRDGAGSRLRAEDVDPRILAGTDIIHLSGITPALSTNAAEAVANWMEAAKRHDTLVSFDVNHRSRLWSRDAARTTLRPLAGLADVLFATADEAEMLTGERDPVDAANALEPAQVLVKLGREGCRARIAGRTFDVAALEVTEVDPVGAGDAFAAGYLAALLEGAPPAERLDLASVMGAFAATTDGDWQGLPTRDELGILRSGEGTTR